MKGPLIYINPDLVLELRMIEVVEPILVHPKADHLYPVHKLFVRGLLADSGLFSGYFFQVPERQILIFTEYDYRFLEKGNIKYDSDVVKNLRLFNFQTMQTGRFSKISGGGFKVKRLEDDKIIFRKIYYDKDIEYEISLDKIQLQGFVLS